MSARCLGAARRTASGHPAAGALRRQSAAKEVRIYYKSGADTRGDFELAPLKERIAAAGIVPREYDDARHLDQLIHSDLWHLAGAYGVPRRAENGESVPNANGALLAPPANHQRQLYRQIYGPKNITKA
jgi:hypothetical protein